MLTRRNIGKLITVEYTDRPTPIRGFLIDFSENWILLKFNVHDYVMDGYIILRIKNIKEYRRGDKELFAEKAIKLKKQHISNLVDFPLSDLGSILSYLTKNYGIFQFELKSEKACYLGKLHSISSAKLTIDYINPKAIWTRQMDFRPNDIRTIEFETDYVNTLKLVAKYSKK
ncbi:MAG: hypothetical protein K2P88_12320 [Chitinophagaceae bacterium]|nr:hypothetical protein [Chitinophagaceae bacterium]